MAEKTNAASNKSLKYFMRDLSEKEEIVEIPGVERYKDEEGNIIPFQVRVLSQKTIMDIYDKYKKKEIAYDKKGHPIVNSGEVAFIVDNDAGRATRRIMVEALIYPNLKDKELMDHYKCPSFDDMPYFIFPKADEYAEVQKNVLIALGISSPDEGEEKPDEIDEAKK
ncbi:MAG: hypothetical protein IJ857_03155 [Lachnospiraceae bacterium]|nr:hypothetical protein [Lachnospiraceae bacterium]